MQRAHLLVHFDCCNLDIVISKKLSNVVICHGSNVAKSIHIYISEFCRNLYNSMNPVAFMV